MGVPRNPHQQLIIVTSPANLTLVQLQALVGTGEATAGLHVLGQIYVRMRQALKNCGLFSLLLTVLHFQTDV